MKQSFFRAVVALVVFAGAAADAGVPGDRCMAVGPWCSGFERASELPVSAEALLAEAKGLDIPPDDLEAAARMIDDGVSSFGESVAASADTVRRANDSLDGMFPSQYAFWKAALSREVELAPLADAQAKDFDLLLGKLGTIVARSRPDAAGAFRYAVARRRWTASGYWWPSARPDLDRIIRTAVSESAAPAETIDLPPGVKELLRSYRQSMTDALDRARVLETEVYRRWYRDNDARVIDVSGTVAMIDATPARARGDAERRARRERAHQELSRLNREFLAQFMAALPQGIGAEVNEAFLWASLQPTGKLQFMAGKRAVEAMLGEGIALGPGQRSDVAALIDDYRRQWATHATRILAMGDRAAEQQRKPADAANADADNAAVAQEQQAIAGLDRALIDATWKLLDDSQREGRTKPVITVTGVR